MDVRCMPVHVHAHNECTAVFISLPSLRATGLRVYTPLCHSSHKQKIVITCIIITLHLYVALYSCVFIQYTSVVYLVNGDTKYVASPTATM